MIITWNNQMETNRNVDNTTEQTTYRATKDVTHSSNFCGYKLDIAGNKVMDNEAYGSQGKTMEAVMQQAQLEDSTVQKNFLTVMSSSVSGEDLRKMEKEGYSAGSTDVETYVNIVDRIKVTMAEAGVIVAGYNDDLPKDVVTDITGSEVIAKELSDQFQNHNIDKTKENYKLAAEAINKLSEITGISEGMCQYMILNHVEPTIENTYLAQYSAMKSTSQAQGYYSDQSGYYAQKANTRDITNLETQIENICKNMGFSDEELKEAVDCGKWLVSQGIELNKENLNQIIELKKIELPKSMDEQVNLVASAMENGKKPGEANLYEEENIVEKAKNIFDNVMSITEDAVEEVVNKEKEINIKNLTASQKELAKNQISAQSENQEESFDVVKAKRQLVEIQLMMTTEANVKLLKSGYQIDILNLSELVDKLREIENKHQSALFNGESQEENSKRSVLYENSVIKLKEMPSLPAAVIGEQIKNGKSITIGSLHESGTILKSTYEKAGETYEALMTAPRKDLGDSIKKAFKNIDAILEEMEIPLTKENKKAVRILAYNNMEITKENINTIKSTDLQVQNVINKMTPQSVLQMIRDGMNPLEISMEELNQYLDQNNMSDENQTKRFSEYLYKLEQNRNITEEEKDAYIGIYRLFRQIEKSDGAVLGSLVNSNAEINMKNILSAVRTRKAQGIDVSIDQDFGELQKIVGDTNSISEQIMNGFTNQQNHQDGKRQQIDYYERLSREIYQNLSVEQMKNSDILVNDNFVNMDIEELKEYIIQDEKQQDYSAKYFEETLKNIRQLANVEESIVETLVAYDQPVNMDNVMAQNGLLNQRGELFKKIASLKKDNEETSDQYEEAVDKFFDEFIDYESANKIYEEVNKSARDIIWQSIDHQNVTQLDVKAANLLFKQLSLATSMAKEENYEIPVTINGEELSVNLRIIHEQEKAGKVSVTMQTKELGNVGVEIEVKGDRIQGFLASDKTDSISELENIKDGLQDKLSNDTDKKVSLQVISTNKLNINKFGLSESAKKGNTEAKKDETTDTKELYKIAMIFVKEISTNV